MTPDLVAALLPTLKPLRAPEFNVFDVMHHGRHENQLSNVFAWLLDPRGTHGLEQRFQGIFVDEVSRSFEPRQALPDEEFSVRQEVDTTPGGVGGDRADIVLESDNSVLVVENYFTSDPHGHSYEGYLAFGEIDGKRSVVVLLCAELNPALVGETWRDAAVVDYPTLLTRLMASLDEDYARRHPAAKTFLDHFHAKYVRGAAVNDDETIEFLAAMCTTGAAEKYGVKNRESAALSFADDLRQRAVDNFESSVEFLRRVKAALRRYATATLVPTVNEALGTEALAGASARVSGSFYEWTVTLDLAAPPPGVDHSVRLRFGPAAWFTNERDPEWDGADRQFRDAIDYSRLLLAHDQRIAGSSVSMTEVLHGLPQGDARLRDGVLGILGHANRAG